ncbi:hypothetical protein TCAP_05926 [Tolypocladium capitatum]|uniref:Uncharacterized protein n=1 Tax=Tolypocladium capitatum TaxID=45235 RepID=A0A2K3Q9B9_9HYPO|nr:hypothetical protein TCAP_05926 [Tolypocladium capitatum]
MAPDYEAFPIHYSEHRFDFKVVNLGGHPYFEVQSTLALVTAQRHTRCSIDSLTVNDCDAHAVTTRQPAPIHDLPRPGIN